MKTVTEAPIAKIDNANSRPQRERFEAHKKQLENAQKADADAAGETGEATSYTTEAPESNGTLASDEALNALREKLAGR